MDEQLRSTGIEPAGLVPWGTHMCLFYRTPGELIDALAAYFKAGLQNNECCVWITSDPLVQAEARLALERLFPEQEQCELRRYRRLGQIEDLRLQRMVRALDGGITGGGITGGGITDASYNDAYRGASGHSLAVQQPGLGFQRGLGF